MFALKWTLEGFSSEVIPQGPRLRITKNGQSISQSYCPEVMDLSVYDRRQTDTAIAGRSEGH